MRKWIKEAPARLYCGIILVLFSVIFALTEDGLKYAVLSMIAGFSLILWWIIGAIITIAENTKKGSE